MLSPRTGEIVAYLEVDIRLALPVTELYRLFLERHPDEKKLLSDRATKRVIENANEIEKAKLTANIAVNTLDDESRMYNELEVVVYNIQGLPKRSDESSPSPYVHFQLLGHPDKFTNPIENTLNPVFNERFAFGMVTNDQQCRLLRRSQLLLTVVDLKGEEEESKGESEGFIGEINVSLASLSEGTAILDSFTLKNNNGDRVGVMRIAVQWKYKFKAQRELGPRALSGVEVECLISCFSPGDGKDGLVEYNSFLRFIDPPLGVSRAMERIQNYIHTVTNREGLSSREILESITEHSARIDEDLFLNCFNRLEIDVLPDEWIQLFRYIDIGDNQSISLDQILAVLNLDEVAGVPPTLQEKLILQMRNLNSRAVNPKHLFQRADQWGDRGLVTRLEFKSVLKKMGFQLVDEPDEADLNIHSVRETKSVLLLSKNDDPLNDTMDSDDILLPSSSHRGVNEDILKQKEIFEKKLAEIQQRTRNPNRTSGMATPQLRTPRAINDSLHSETDIANPNQVVGKNMLDTKPEHPNPFPNGEHRTSVGRRSDGGGMDYDISLLDSSARKLQRSYRGYSARKRFQGSPSGDVGADDSSYRLYNHDTNKMAIEDKPSEPAGSFRKIGILNAEDILREALSQLQGIQPTPNFLGTFLKVDRKGENYVSRKQFAFVMSQFIDVVLPPEILREFMDYFDTSNNGNKIDYQAFCKFCNYRPLEILPAIKGLKHMVMDPNAILRFRSLDTAGTGFLSRQEILRVLSELGFGYFTQKQTLDMIALFETRVDGQVNYSNFVEFVRDNSLSRSVDGLCEKIKCLVMEKGGVQESNLRRWFRRFDKEGNGVVSLSSFIDFLAEFDLQMYPKQVISVVYNFINIDGQGKGISFHEFSTWMSTPIDLHLSMYSTTTKAEIQRKCHSYLVSLASYQETSLEELTQSYLIYDWRAPPSGAVGKGEFIRASILAGFPLSHAELRSLTAEFLLPSDDLKVLYKKFLTWATPTSGGAQVSDSIKSMTTQSPHKRTAAIVRFLEQCIERKIDIQAVFGRYDTSGSGRIMAGEFASALSDLGLSSVSQFDIMELADRFKAIAGDFVIYRRIIAELLNQIDTRIGAADLDIVDVVKAAVSKRSGGLGRLEDAFKYYDRKGMGRVHDEDLGTIFEEAKIHLSRQELELFANKYSIGPSGWIQFAAFMSTLKSRLGLDPGSEISRSVQGLPDDLANKVSWLLETLILKGKDFRTELDAFDDRFTGAILQADFREVLQDRFRSGFTPKDLEILEKVYRDRSDPRKVNFVKMLQELHPRNLKSATPEILNLLEVAENLRSKIRKRCDYLSPGELNRPFRHFARKSIESGFSPEEFSIGIKDLGILLAWDQEKSLFEMMNLDGAKAIRYNNFVVFVCDPHHDDVIWKLRRGIRRARISEVELLDAIDEHDTNCSGLITSKQFMKALRSSNIDMSEQDLLRLMLRFDNEEAQRFDIQLFRRFLIGEVQGDELKPQKSQVRTLVAENSPKWKSAEGTEIRVINGLQGRILDQLDIGLTPSEIFAVFDESKKGSIDLVSLMQGGRELGVTMSRAEGRNVLRRLSLLAGGVIDKVGFFEALGIDIGKKKKENVMVRIDEDEPPLGIMRTLKSLSNQVSKNIHTFSHCQ
jgi:Ca2+-binding EF-hand superfamily protein